MRLPASLITLIFITVVNQSQCSLDAALSVDSLSEVDVEYRPWEHNDTSTVWISLEGTRMGTINDVLRLNVPGLRWLVMDRNEITKIPSEAFQFLPDLTYISLAGNKISIIDPQAFSHLDNLRVIDLDGNLLNVYYYAFDSKVFSGLPGLKRLYLRGCGLPSFDAPQYLDNLSHLYLSRNQLRNIEINGYPALTHVYLDNNNLETVSLSSLESLVYLDLSRNNLQTIVIQSEHTSHYTATRLGRTISYSSASAKIPDLQYLIVSFNQISEITPDVFLGAESLVHLDLTNNQITEVHPGAFNNLLQVENILLDSNKITTIYCRTFANLPNLKMISLKNNEITEIEEDAFAKLDSGANEVQMFLDNNKIHTLRRTSFVGIKGLKHIGLSENRIKIISSYAFVDLPNLESLVIENQKYNQDESSRGWGSQIQMLEPKKGIIESHAFINLPNLTSIKIGGNIFGDIEPEAFHELSKLKLLDLSDNGIENLSSEAFSHLPTLEDLHLGGNSISEITPETFPKQLKYLDLAWNNLCPDFGCWNVSELHQLEELNVSGIIDRLKIDDVVELPKNLTVLFGRAQAPP